MKIEIVRLIIIFLTISSSAFATDNTSHKITGTITSSSGETLVGAIVTIDAYGRKPIYLTVDIDGHFGTNISPDKYTFSVSYIGYDTYNDTIIVDKDIEKDVELQFQALSMTQIEIKHSSKAKRLRESGFAVKVIDIASNAGTINNLSDVVTQSTGVHVRREGGLGSDFDLTLNGMGGNTIRYFIDGLPLESKGSDYTLDNIAINLVDRIEIYKGVVPAHLGGDALGGAVNIITKDSYKNYFDMSYGYGSFGTQKFDFNAKIIDEKTGITIKPSVGVNYSKNNYIMQDVRILNPESSRFEIADCRRFHDDYLSIFGQVDVGVNNRSWADYFYVSGSVNKIDKDIQNGATQDVVYGKATRESLAININARYQKRDFLLKNLLFNGQVSYTWNTSSIIDTAKVMYYWNGYHKPSSDAELNTDPMIRNINNPSTSVRSNFDYKFNDQHSVNFNYLFNSTENRVTKEMSFEDKEETTSNDMLNRHFIGLSYSLSLFDARWLTSLSAKEYVNSVSLGDRDYDASDAYYTGFDGADRDMTQIFTGYGVNSRYRLNDVIALKASYEYSVRLPGVTEILGNGENIYPNYKLEAEKSHNYNLGGYGSVEFNDHTLGYEMGLFYRDVFDFIMAVPGREDFTYKNLSNITISGAEGELTYRWKNRLKIKTNMSYESAIDMMQSKVNDGKPNAAYKQKIPNRPSLYGYTSVDYVFRDILGSRDKLSLGYSFNYVRRFSLTWESYGHPDSKSIIPTQRIHSVMMAYSWADDRYSISADCSNIFDALAYDNYKLQKPGRSVFCKFRYLFNKPNSYNQNNNYK